MGLNEKNKFKIPGANMENRSDRLNSSCVGSDSIDESRTSEVPPIVPCYNGKTLKIHEELVGNGLSAISIKHHKGNCKDEKKISKRDTKTKPTKKKAKENKENEGHSKKSSGICYKDFPETAEVPECLKDKMKRRNSFWNVHRPDLSKLTWPENFVSSAVLQDFFHNHLRIHGTFCEPLHESNNRSSIIDEEIRDFSKLREIAPPRILPPDEKIVNIMEKSRSLQLNDEDLDPETQVHKSRAEFCVTIGEYIRRPLVKRTISQQMTKSPLQPANRFESLPVQHEGLLSKETMLSEERISAVIGSLDFSPVGNSSKKSSKGGSANFSTAAYKRGSNQDSQRSPPSHNTLSIMGEFSDHSQVTEDSGDPARLRTILSPRDETAGCSESRHNKV